MVSSASSPVRPLRRVEYDKLVSLGTFEGERVELIAGELRRMSPIGPPHMATVDRLTELLVLALAGRARVRIQGSFAAGDLSEPEPDVSVLPLGDYDSAHPEVAHLIIEVADSSLRYDRGEKAQLYALCGVQEYWVVNLIERVVETHRQPGAAGYEHVSVHGRGERLRLLAFPNVELSVSDFLR
jgi:Uma2 family endonuclease